MKSPNETKPIRLALASASAMLAFAGNSLLCRFALKQSGIDAASFTFIRIVSGAAALVILALLRGRFRVAGGDWISAFALFAYAAAFSFAYLSLSAGTGALMLFGSVQATMILWGWRRGERIGLQQLTGLTLAAGGLVVLLLPGITAPPWRGSLLMIAAGLAWGVYSLRGQAAGDPITATTGNFLRASVFAFALILTLHTSAHLNQSGVFYAVLSGAIASGMGYVIWYGVLPHLQATSAATLQLSVPVIAAAGAILLLGESISARLIFASVAVLGGIALVLRTARQRGFCHDAQS